MQRLFDIKKTQLEMVRDRGYDITNEEAILTMTLEQFIGYISGLATQMNTPIRGALSRMYISRQKYDDVNRNMLVYYGGKTNPQQKQVSADVVRQFIALIQSYRVFEAVIIVDAPLSSTGNDELSALKLVRWQVFFDSDLTYNPINHVDTPWHELLPEAVAIAKLREMKVDVSKLLIIKTDDPVVRYYGWPPGGIICTHRDDSAVSVLAPKSINYRVIIG